jgi:glycosyltransferase involved in cell wall biosynthesis
MAWCIEHEAVDRSRPSKRKECREHYKVVRIQQPMEGAQAVDTPNDPMTVSTHRQGTAEGDGPRASFVIPLYNGAPTIRETVAAAQDQTESNVEIVVVDDGSHDNGAEIVLELAQQDPRIVLVRQGNQGPEGARNRGGRCARAPYLCFLDQDDLVSKTKVETQAAILDARQHVDLVYSRVYAFMDVDKTATRRIAIPEDPNAIVEFMLTGQGGFPPAAALLRRSAFERVGGFEYGFPVAEDYHFFVKLALSGSVFAFSTEEPVLYRVQSGSYSSDRNRQLVGILTVLGWLQKEIQVTAARHSGLIARRMSELANRTDRLDIRHLASFNSPLFGPELNKPSIEEMPRPEGGLGAWVQRAKQFLAI